MSFPSRDLHQALRDARTYHLSDERLRAFAQLTPLQRLLWVEDCAHFVRLGQEAMRQATAGAPARPAPSPASSGPEAGSAPSAPTLPEAPPAAGAQTALGR